MIRLCIVRHAIAVERGTPGYANDGLRPLTAEGRERMEANAAGLRALFTPTAIVSSPLLRARQTAEILGGVFPKASIRYSDALVAGDHDALLAELRGGDAAVAVVGHEPHVSSLLSYVLTADEGRVAAVFKKGTAALAGFEGDPAPGRAWLEWLLQPAALRLAGGAGRAAGAGAKGP